MRMNRVDLCRFFSLVLVGVLLPACDDAVTYNPPPPDEPEAMQLRIVSLAPALTQMVVDLGKGESIVGVAQHDDAAPVAGLPVVGNYQAIDTEALLKLKPTLVLMMTGVEGPPANLQRAASSDGFRLVTYPSPLSVSQVAEILFYEADVYGLGDETKPRMPSLGVVLGDFAHAQSVKLNMFRRLAAIDRALEGAGKPSVLMVIGTGPVMASGPGTVHDELLGNFAGGMNAAGDAKIGAPTYDREALLGLKPEVVLLLMPGSPPLKPLEEDERLAEFRGLDIPAVTNNRIVLINDPLTLLPSTSLPRIAAAMAKAIHPDRAKAIDEALDAPLPELPDTPPPTPTGTANNIDAAPASDIPDEPAAAH